MSAETFLERRNVSKKNTAQKQETKKGSSVAETILK